MIFNIFKSKPTLKELIKNGFIDIHCHILPCLDDGAKNVNESINLISKMEELGFSKIIATPHTYKGIYDNTTDDIKKSYESVRNNIDSSLQLEYASEYMIDDSLFKKIENRDLLTLVKNYVLIEMSYLDAPKGLYDIIYKFRLADYIPILAHPERYRFFYNKFSEYEKLKNMGCLFQINLLSTTGYYGKDVLKMCDKLLLKSMVDFVGSDIHNLNHIKQFDKKVNIKNIRKLETAIKANFLFK